MDVNHLPCQTLMSLEKRCLLHVALHVLHMWLVTGPLRCISWLGLVGGSRPWDLYVNTIGVKTANASSLANARNKW